MCEEWTEKRLKKVILLMPLMLIILLSYHHTHQLKSPIYKGNRLIIGVIGYFPKVRENNITFKAITFNQLTHAEKISSDYDAVFIMKNHLDEASKGKYAKTYKALTIPTFFIQSTKSYTPFIIKNLTYNKVPDTHDQMYATGILYKGNGCKTWGYGLYNDTLNEMNIEDVYSRIFKTISSQKKLP